MTKKPSERKAKILILITTLVRGGCELHLVNTLPFFDKNLFQIDVFIVGAQRGILANDLEKSGIRIHAPWLEAKKQPKNPFIRLYYLIQVCLHLFYVLIRHRPDIVHCYLPLSYLVGLPLAMITRRPFIMMSRRSLNTYQLRYPLLSRLEHFFHRFTTVLLGNSKGVIRDLIQKEGANPAKTCLIYNGVKHFPPISLDEITRLRHDMNLTEDHLVLSCVANLIPYKGHQDLLSALASIKSQLPQTWRLLLIGRDDGIGTKLKEQAARAGLSDHISFLGSRADVPALLSISQIGLLCSHQEGFSNAVLEGMSAGLPMIVTDVGGNAEAVLDQVTGLVVPSHSPEKLAEAILDLATNSNKRQTMGQTGQRRVQEHFSMEVCIQRYSQIYEAVLTRKPIGFVESDGSSLEKMQKTCT